MSTVAELQTALAEVEAKLNSGESMKSIDGATITYDLEALAKRRQALKKEIAALQGGGTFLRRGRYNSGYSSS